MRFFQLMWIPPPPSAECSLNSDLQGAYNTGVKLQQKFHFYTMIPSRSKLPTFTLTGLVYSQLQIKKIKQLRQAQDHLRFIEVWKATKLWSAFGITMHLHPTGVGFNTRSKECYLVTCKVPLKSKFCLDVERTHIQ